MSETGWAVDDAELLAPFFSQEAKTHLGDPPLRSRKEKQARKGLPADENLRKLAEVWLSESRKLWPQLAERGLADAGHEPQSFLRRHQSGDWGDVDKVDWAANDRAVADGERILSAYGLSGGQRLWIITEATREVTMLLLPEEY